MRTFMKLFAVCAFVALAASVPTVSPSAASGPQLGSIGPLAFGPNGVLYAGDSVGGKIYALDLGAQSQGGAQGTANVENISQKIAGMLGTDAAQIAVTDLAVDQRTHNSYVSVMRGQGAAAKPALFRVDGAGKLSMVNMDTVQYTSVDLPNLPASNPEARPN